MRSNPIANTIFAVLLLTILDATAEAARPPRLPIPPRNRGMLVRHVEMDGEGHKDNEIEGAIWEYKIVPSSKAARDGQAAAQTKRGKLRIKGQAIYLVSAGPLAAESEHRVGDVAYSDNGNTLQLRFDDHPELTGRAVLKPGKSRQEGGVYTGYYLDENRNRSKIELRRGED